MQESWGDFDQERRRSIRRIEDSKRSRSRATFDHVDRRARVEDDSEESIVQPQGYESVRFRRASSRESSSTEFYTDEDESDPDPSGPNRARRGSSPGPRRVLYRVSSSSNDWSAGGNASERSGRPYDRYDDDANVQWRVTRGSSDYEDGQHIERKRRSTPNGIFLAPPDFDEYGHRSRSAGPDMPAKTYLKMHHSPEDFNNADNRPKEIRRIDRQVQSSVSTFDDLARTSRDKEEVASRAETDLTFRKITTIAEDAQYRVKAWSLGVQLPDATRVAPGDADTIRDMHDNFDALQDITRDLNVICARARPDDLAERPGDTEAYIDYLIERKQSPSARRGHMKDPVGFRVREKLAAIEARLQNIELLNIPIKESIEPNLQPSLRRKIVQDAERYFGSEEKLRKYLVPPGLGGEEALRMAKATYSDDATPAAQPTAARNPVVYQKVHERYLDTETLEFYRLRWERDKENPRYIIILQDSSTYQIEVLFEHSRRLRARRQAELQFASEMRSTGTRGPSRSRSRSGSREPPRILL